MKPAREHVYPRIKKRRCLHARTSRERRGAISARVEWHQGQRMTHRDANASSAKLAVGLNLALFCPCTREKPIANCLLIRRTYTRIMLATLAFLASLAPNLRLYSWGNESLTALLHRNRTVISRLQDEYRWNFAVPEWNHHVRQIATSNDTEAQLHACFMAVNIVRAYDRRAHSLDARRVYASIWNKGEHHE